MSNYKLTAGTPASGALVRPMSGGDVIRAVYAYAMPMSGGDVLRAVYALGRPSVGAAAYPIKDAAESHYRIPVCTAYGPDVDALGTGTTGSFGGCLASTSCRGSP